MLYFSYFQKSKLLELAHVRVLRTVCEVRAQTLFLLSGQFACEWCYMYSHLSNKRVYLLNFLALFFQPPRT